MDEAGRSCWRQSDCRGSCGETGLGWWWWWGGQESASSPTLTRSAGCGPERKGWTFTRTSGWGRETEGARCDQAPLQLSQEGRSSPGRRDWGRSGPWNQPSPASCPGPTILSVVGHPGFRPVPLGPFAGWLGGWVANGGTFPRRDFHRTKWAAAPGRGFCEFWGPTRGAQGGLWLGAQQSVQAVLGGPEFWDAGDGTRESECQTLPRSAVALSSQEDPNARSEEQPELRVRKPDPERAEPGPQPREGRAGAPGVARSSTEVAGASPGGRSARAGAGTTLRAGWRERAGAERVERVGSWRVVRPAAAFGSRVAWVARWWASEPFGEGWRAPRRTRTIAHPTWKTTAFGGGARAGRFGAFPWRPRFSGVRGRARVAERCARPRRFSKCPPLPARA